MSTSIFLQLYLLYYVLTYMLEINVVKMPRLYEQFLPLPSFFLFSLPPSLSLFTLFFFFIPPFSLFLTLLLLCWISIYSGIRTLETTNNNLSFVHRTHRFMKTTEIWNGLCSFLTFPYFKGRVKRKAGFYPLLACTILSFCPSWYLSLLPWIKSQHLLLTYT